MTKSIREHFQQTDSYHVICREERNLCALLYHLLLSNQDNLPIFLEAIGGDPTSIKEPEIYVEYAHLRDCWYALGSNDCSSMNREQKEAEEEKKNKIRREFILEALELESWELLRNCSVAEFNRLFFAKRENAKSEENIASPSRWSVKQIAGSCKAYKLDNDAFIRIVRFKWCFNVKPDIVIFPTADKAISIEAKLESLESKYPSGKEETKIFKKLGIEKIYQTKIQKQAFKILGIEAAHVMLSKHGRGDQSFAWKDVFGKLIIKQEPEFIRQQIDSFLNRC